MVGGPRIPPPLSSAYDKSPARAIDWLTTLFSVGKPRLVRFQIHQAVFPVCPIYDFLHLKFKLGDVHSEVFERGCSPTVRQMKETHVESVVKPSFPALFFDISCGQLPLKDLNLFSHPQRKTIGHSLSQKTHKNPPTAGIVETAFGYVNGYGSVELFAISWALFDNGIGFSFQGGLSLELFGDESCFSWRMGNNPG